MKATDAEGVYRTSSQALPATEEERQHEQRRERYQLVLAHALAGFTLMAGETVRRESLQDS